VNNLDTALVTNDTSVLHALVLAADTLKVSYWSKDLGAEETVTLRLERPVVDGFRIFHFAATPGPDDLGRGNCDGNLVKGFRLLVDPVKFAQICLNTHDIVN
jgi:hypothetical protein